LLNETILEKQLLHPLKKLTETNGVLGLNIAHTGSIIALWFDETKVSEHELKEYVRAIDTKGYYKQYHVFQTIPGGVRRKEGVIH
jgi:L-threonine kinase